MTDVVVLELPPRPDLFAVVRLVVSSTATVDGRLSEHRVDDLRLAVSEACANAVDALHERGRGDTTVVVTIELAPHEVAVTVTDRAGGFEPAGVATIPGATEPERLRHERGLGISLMRSLVDEVTFTATPEGTAVRLAVRLPEPAGHAG